MKYFLPTFGLLISFFPLFAQKPVSSPESICNNAGTITIGPLIGQSSLTDPELIFLCSGDSLRVRHNGDAIFSGDPDPATESGIAFGLYYCAPLVSGDNLQAIGTIPGPGDPCVVDNPASPWGIHLTTAVPNGGDTWFDNSGFEQTEFAFGQPVGLHYAPITIDNWQDNLFEKLSPDGDPGPCVNVNTKEEFSIVYLNPISATSIDNFFGDDCIGKFRINGGFPEYDVAATYAIDISLAGDPSVKALIQSPDIFHLHNQTIIFSITKPGTYNITAEDNKSCGLQFTMNMSGCNSSDNLVVVPDSLSAAPGSEICLPIRVRNFDIVSGSLSVNWNPALLEYRQTTNYHPAIASFFSPNTFLNTTVVSLGQLGMVLLDPNSIGATIHIPDDEALMDICFKVLDTLEPCANVEIYHNPAPVAFENELGEPVAITVIPGQVCYTPASSTAVEPDQGYNRLYPNPVKAGETALLLASSEKGGQALVRLQNTQGLTVLDIPCTMLPGVNRLAVSTTGLAPGVYFAGLYDQSGRRTVHTRLVVYR